MDYQKFIIVALVLGILIFILLAIKFMQGKNLIEVNTKNLKLVSSVNLRKDCSIHVVQLENSYFLVSASRNSSGNIVPIYLDKKESFETLGDNSVWDEDRLR